MRRLPPIKQPDQMKIMNLSRLDQLLLKLSEEEARELIADHVVRQCCFSARLLKTLTVVGVASHEAFYYTLISWYERHTVKERFVPYHGGPLDSRLNGPEPPTWDLKRPIPAAFTDAQYSLPLPHSEETLGCPHCFGVGYVNCRRCRRKGKVSCLLCHGHGEELHRCTMCAGKGTVRCPACRGRVGVECPDCAGSGRLKRYRIVQVAWSVAFDYVVLNGSDLPSYRLSETDGLVIHRQVGPRVGLSEAAFPLSLVMACEVLVNRQLSCAGADTRVLLQKHIVRLIPVNQCDYRWSGADPKLRRFFVYGRERRVHREKAPTALCTLRDALLDRGLKARAAKAAAAAAAAATSADSAPLPPPRPAASSAGNPTHSIAVCSLL